MTAVGVTLYVTRPVQEQAPDVTAPVMVGLDQFMDSAMCACNASDDNPH
jgi:hypothetical protein